MALQPVVQGPGYESASYGTVNYIDASAILGDGVLHTFLVNRSLAETARVEIDHPGGQLLGVQSAEIVTGNNPQVQNTFEQPDRIISRPFQAAAVRYGQACVELPPLSVAAVSFNTA
jgi:alpha-N-arabinofuranosidase